MRPALLLAAALTLTTTSCRHTNNNPPTYSTCEEAQQHETTPIPRGHPAYRLIWDYDNDGLACEPGNP